MMSQLPMMTTYTYQPDNLVAGLTQLVTRSYVLAAGQVVARGTLLGMVTATGKVTLATATATDGSQVPFGIALDYYDATAGDLAGCGVYLKGEFNNNAITFGAGLTAANTADALRAVGIFLKPVVTTVGTYIG